MKTLCEILDVITNPAIIVTALIEFVLLCVSVWILIRLRYRITSLNKKELVNRGKSRKEARGKVTRRIELESRRDWDEFDRFLEDYQREGCWYSAFSLIIQIFTLLGILGTVAGLYLAMSNGEDMYEGVELALSTTVLGILFAVIYKVADIVITSALINYIEDGINRYEKIYKVDSEDAMTTEETDKGKR